SQTPLTLHASDNLTYWTGVKNLTIIITNSSGTFSHTILDNENHDMDPRLGYITHTFFLSDECLNILGFYAWDAYNNETLDGNIITFEVIDTPPDLMLSIGEPQKPCYVQMGDICYPAVSPITPIIIQTSCTHNCQHYVDLEYLTIEIYHGEQYGLWNLVQTTTIIDNDEQDIDNNNDIILVEIHLEENCWYQIHYWAEDKLGNRNPAQGQIRTKEIFVDAQGPQSDHWFTGPQYVTAHRWITNQTIFHIRSIDLGCNGPGIGVNFTEWWLLKKQGDTWIETYREIIYDDSEHDVENTTQGILGVQISIEDDGEHYINHQSTDELGNKGPVHKHLVRVDNKPPLSSLTIGQPSCSYLNDEGEEIFCIRTNTPIRINSQDTPVGCAVGILYIEYEIYRGSQRISFGEVYDVDHIDFSFNEECSHTLWYRAVDLLNNIEEWNIQEFNVDDQKPSIQLTVMQPSIKTMHNHPHYWVRSDTIIQINGQDHGSCPVWTIRYRIDNGAWVDITDLVRPYHLTLPYECKYTLEIEAFDCIGNTERLIKRFYVDNSAPLFHIIKPHNGIYKAGDTIHVTYYAKDLAVNSPPCYENHAVGFSSNHKAEAYIIDFRPQFMICELDTTDLKYYQDSLEYDGNIIIPSDCSIPNGSAYFVSGVSDLLHNGEHSIRDIIEHYYMTYGVDS
ncbi:MAG: hypothetical protein QCH96_07800, partial [Candidatus Thermoplasmatota archaeon]|nr:hypothetical protein [Candidatus Thermoplasmatota archaeon]